MNQTIKKLFLPLYRWWYDLKWKLYVRRHPEVNVVIGSGQISADDWFETDILVLDVTREDQFRRFFSRHKIRRVVAEHVLEHLTTAQIEQMLQHITRYATPDVNVRIAVPDGYHGDAAYIERVKPGGSGAGADDHKHLFTYQTLAGLFAQQGFQANLLEYWDEHGQFHSTYQDDDKGIIRRSLPNDPRNADGQPHYTSLIIDFTRRLQGQHT